MKLVATLFLGAAASAAAASAKRTAMETDVLVAEEYTNWASAELAADAKAKATMDVFFMMKHDAANVAKLEETLYAVSDPRSERYGQHLSLDEIKELTPIDPAGIKAVTSFLAEAGVDAERVAPNHNEDIIVATVTLEEAEFLFETEIRQFSHKHKSATVFRAAQAYSLPEDVAEVVSFVGDLVRVPSLLGARRVPVPTDGASDEWPDSCPGLNGRCKALTNPGVLNERYNITASTLDTAVQAKGVAAGNSFAVAEFQGQYYDDKDLATFNTGCDVNVTVDKVVGKDIQEGGVEAILDVEYIGALSDDIPLTFYYQAEYSLLKWATDVNNDEDAALVHSVSYGNDERQQTGAEYIYSSSTQFMKMGTRGLSVLFASGDQGVCGRSGCSIFRKKFNPDFPAACPYITAVGGTDFATHSVIGDEKAWTDGGGGFSDYFAIPSFQTDAVAAYKANPDADLPPASFYNDTGRGYPDVAALGGEVNAYCVFVDGVAQGVAGTSASCPVTASIFAKLNGVRLAAGKPALGFLNPFIYQNAQGFHDVTQGKNTGGSAHGFQATTGWDPATGMGTPNFGLLKEAVEALP